MHAEDDDLDQEAPLDQSKTRVYSRPSTLPAPLEACVVKIYHGGEATADLGRRYLLDREIGVGRDPSNTVCLEMDNVSRRHARFFVEGGVCYVEDLRSTNGTFVGEKEVVGGPATLTNGDLVKVGSAIFKFISGGNIEALCYEELYQVATHDGLTKIYNRRYFTDLFERELARAVRRGHQLSLVLFDIDHFKSINDTYGHLAGDQVLKGLSDAVQQRVRRDEVFARTGGEEFALLLPETDCRRAAAVAEDIRELVEHTEVLFEGQKIRVTISLGVAELTDQSAPEEFLKIADERLYQAKESGRNRVVAEPPGSADVSSSRSRDRSPSNVHPERVGPE